ncbi:universal stress protein [Halorarius halobius]|uniref:universal stress protein n=1 Tax=Halorarius halobius TaxID=2962671 RepID=UPI0020CCE242|nr:universal stress protein [Halorarius halobius]
MPVLTDQLKVATTLARVTGASLTVINPFPAPEQTEVYRHEVTDSEDASLLDWVFEQTDESLPQVESDFLYARDVVRGVLQAVRRRDVDTLLVPSSSGTSRFRKRMTEQLATHADADVIVVNGQAGFSKAASILLPIASGPHSGLAADVATSIAADYDAWIDILHVIDEEASDHQRERAETLVEDIYHRIARPETTATWVLEAPDTAEAIIDQSRYYGLSVIGAPTKSRLRRFIFGSTNATVRADADSVVLSARNNSDISETR